jgi:hypothetical protein
VRISIEGLRLRAFAVAAAVCAIGTIAVGAVSAGTSAALTVQVLPGSLSAGQTGLAVVSLVNNGKSTLTHAVLTVTFPSAVSVTAPQGCAPATGSTSRVACSVGKLGEGTSVKRTISFDVPAGSSSLQLTAVATWNSDSRGHGEDHGFSAPRGRLNDGRSFLTATSAPATVFPTGDSTHVGTCATSSAGSLDAELDGQGTELPSVPTVDASLGLPCTPLALGVEPQPAGFPAGFTTDVAVVDLPLLQQPATVLLSFPDEKLPGSRDNRNPLREFPSWPDTSVVVTVPQCQGGAIPSGYDACIAGVTPNDPDRDADAGTMTLLVQGSGLGDPRFAG